MSLVLDAFLALAWYFEDEATPATEEVPDRVAENGAAVPTLWRLEVGNALQMAIRRKRIDVAYRDNALAELLALPIVIDAETDARAWTTILSLSDRFGLTLHDAINLELAQRLGLPLATLDATLRMAGLALDIPLLGSAAR